MPKFLVSTSNKYMSIAKYIALVKLVNGYFSLGQIQARRNILKKGDENFFFLLNSYPCNFLKRKFFS